MLNAAYMAGGADMRWGRKMQAAVPVKTGRVAKAIIVHPQNAKTNPQEFVRQKRARLPYRRSITDPKNFAFRFESAAYLTCTYD